jgi:hypothetical protein
MLVKVYEKAWRTDPDPRKLYRRLGKAPGEYEREVAEAKRDAKTHRELTRGRKRPPGLGERIFTIPGTLYERLLQANPHLRDPKGGLSKEGVCFLWHEWCDFRCVDGRCPTCGRK